MRKPLMRCFALLTLPLFCGCQALFFRAVNTGHADVTVTTRVYAPEHALMLDIYRPARSAVPMPVALFFYGGSWRSGSRKDYAFVGNALARQGILTIVADYRKYPAVRFPGFELDAARAARWTFDHIGEYGGDPQRVFLVGHSAGAQIAALLVTDAHYLATENLRPRDFAGVIGIAGPYDFLPLTDPKLIEVFGPEKDWGASQPIRFVHAGEPPFLLLHGDGDRVVWPRNSTAMNAALLAAGAPVRLKQYPGIGHFRIIAALRYPSLGPTLGDMVTFIEQTPAAAARTGD